MLMHPTDTESQFLAMPTHAMLGRALSDPDRQNYPVCRNIVIMGAGTYLPTMSGHTGSGVLQGALAVK